MWLYFFILLAAGLLWLVYEWWEHTFVQYHSAIIEMQKLSQEKPLRLCLISDLHNNKKNLKKLTQRLLEFAPDAILLAGDIVDKHKTVNYRAEEFLRALGELSIPVFYSAGNHELFLAQMCPKEWKAYLERLPENVRFLDNEAAFLKGRKQICISGLSLPESFYKKGSLYEESNELPDISIPDNQLHILLAHHPEYASMYRNYHADLIVSGHLHGGLLRLPFIGGVVSPRFRLPVCDSGQRMLPDGSALFVSRGLGSHTIPLRFFNRVEVNFLILQGKEK